MLSYLEDGKTTIELFIEEIKKSSVSKEKSPNRYSYYLVDEKDANWFYNDYHKIEAYNGHLYNLIFSFYNEVQNKVSDYELKSEYLFFLSKLKFILGSLKTLFSEDSNGGIEHFRTGKNTLRLISN